MFQFILLSWPSIYKHLMITAFPFYSCPVEISTEPQLGETSETPSKPAYNKFKIKNTSREVNTLNFALFARR